MADRIQVVEVGRFDFVRGHTLVELRRVVDVLLAKRGEKHKDAAERAGVGRAYWSKLMNSKRITHTDLETIARGLAVDVDDLVQRCAA